MPSNDRERDRETPIPVREKRNNMIFEIIKFAVYLCVLIVGGTVFVFLSQASQDERIADACAKIQTAEARHEEHVKQATAAFEKIDRTLLAQQDVLVKTQTSIAGMEVAQRQMVDEVKRVRDELSMGRVRP